MTRDDIAALDTAQLFWIVRHEMRHKQETTRRGWSYDDETLRLVRAEILNRAIDHSINAQLRAAGFSV